MAGIILPSFLFENANLNDSGREAIFGIRY